MTVCLPGATFEEITERVGQVMGDGRGGSILVPVDNPPTDGGDLSEWEIAGVRHLVDILPMHVSLETTNK